MKQVSLSPELIREKAVARKEPDWLVDARLEAFATYGKLAEPRYRRTDLRGIDVPALALRAFLRASGAAERPAVRHEGLVHLGLAEAAREHEDLVRPILTAAPDVTATKWDALHAALWTTGTFVHVPRGVEVAEPVVTHTQVSAEGALVRDVLVADRLSRATLVDRWTGGAATGGALATASLDMHVHEGANVQVSLVQELGHATTLLSTRRAHIGRDARLGWIDGQFGGGKCIVVNESLLEAQGAKVDFLGAFFGGLGQHFDITTSALHRAKHTESQLNMRGALNEHGYAANYSIVFISEKAPNSSGHQHQETLILGEGAHADAIPKLDVENNDVSASHGATVGQVDPEQVFYLKARGLDELGAKRLIVEGFFEPLLREIPLEGVREEIATAIVKRLK